MTATVVTLAGLLAAAIAYIVALEILLRRAHAGWQEANAQSERALTLARRILDSWRRSDELWQAIVDAIRNDPASHQENP